MRTNKRTPKEHLRKSKGTPKEESSIPLLTLFLGSSYPLLTLTKDSAWLLEGFSSKCMFFLRVPALKPSGDSLKFNKNLNHFIKIKIVSTNKVVPKMPVWRHVNIGTIDSGQNICPIYIIRWDSSFVISLSLNGDCLPPWRSLPPSVIQWYRLLWSNSRVVFVVFPFQWLPWGRVEGTDKRK